MAPNFEKNMYAYWQCEKEIIVLICFSSSDCKCINIFRDNLVKEMKNNFYVNKIEGIPTEHDSIFRFFDNSDKKIVEEILGRKINFFQRLFKTKTYKMWETDFKTLEKMIKCEIETSHDFPCIVLKNVIFTVQEIQNLIEKIAKEMTINVFLNKNLASAEEVIKSNETFG